ncbi:MAG: GNAT family protein [Tissierellia bacterium]|nr:GNAT family protein [Tissierellia bacterium]
MLKSKRMHLRPARPEDLDWIMDLERDPANNRFVWQGTRAQHLEEIEDPDYYLLVHEDRETGQRVGYSLCHMDRAMDSFELRRIVSSVRGQAYGREAILLLMGLAFDQEGAHRFWLDVYPHNPVGIRLYEDLGMVREGRLRGSYKAQEGYWDQLIYSILEEEWEERKAD